MLRFTWEVKCQTWSLTLSLRSLALTGLGQGSSSPRPKPMPLVGGSGAGGLIPETALSVMDTTLTRSNKTLSKS